MNLLDKYISAIGRHLPRKNRADIEAEIRSTLEDMFEERNQGKGAVQSESKDPADEALVIELLKEYGSPAEVAATYKSPQHQYLIGPRMYPIFERVGRIVFAIVSAASLIGLGIALTKTGLTGPEFASSLGEWFGGLISGLMAAFGNIVLVFAILERTRVMDNEFEKESREWDPKDLKEDDTDPDRIDMADHIATIIFTFLGLVVFNLYPDLFAIRFSSDGTWTTLPVLTDVFFRFLPWINVMGLVQIIFSGYMLSQKEWIPITRIFGILVDVAGMALAVVILRTPDIFGVTPEMLTAIGDPEAVDVLSKIFNFVPTIVIVVIVVVTTIKVLKSILRLFSSGSSSPYPQVK
jgi:hypothetical protein